MQKIKIISNIILATLFALIISYIFGTKYIQQKYLTSVKSYYTYVEDNTKRIDRFIYSENNEQSLMTLFSYLETYFFINNELILSKTFSNIDEVLAWQKSNFSKINLATYIDMYHSSKELDDSIDNLKNIIDEQYIDENHKIGH